jgi:NDP-sugar pyrophosphorylase family protein
MIVAAGLGTRMRPLSTLRPKPALPVRGLPLVALHLALLARSGVDEIVINVHPLPELLEAAARRHCPPGVKLSFSREERLLGTGGGIRRVAAFLRESDPSLILGGDMIVDADLRALIARHRERGDAWTLLLREGDARAARFGSIGADALGRVRRIARRFDLGGEVASGLYTWVNVVAARAFDAMPEREVFGHLDEWLAPMLAAGANDVRAELERGDVLRWEPVGTPDEYLAANLHPPALSYLDWERAAREAGVRIEGDLVLGAGATLGAGASLHRCVVWDGERVPAGLRASDGVFAAGRFHPCPAREEGGS